jgi:hypothetical protein
MKKVSKLKFVILFLFANQLAHSQVGSIFNGVEIGENEFSAGEKNTIH